jgi:hypothetical protein
MSRYAFRWSLKFRNHELLNQPYVHLVRFGKAQDWKDVRCFVCSLSKAKTNPISSQYFSYHPIMHFDTKRFQKLGLLLWGSTNTQFYEMCCQYWQCTHGGRQRWRGMSTFCLIGAQITDKSVLKSGASFTRKLNSQCREDTKFFESLLGGIHIVLTETFGQRPAKRPLYIGHFDNLKCSKEVLLLLQNKSLSLRFCL